MSKFSKNRTTEVQPDRESLLMGIADAVSNDGSVHDPNKYDTVPSPESRLKEIAARQKNKKTDKLLTTEKVLTEASTSLNIGHQSSAIRAPWDGPIPNVGDEVEVTVLLPEGETFTWGGFTYIAAPSFTQKAIAYEGRGGVIKIAFDEDIPIVVDSRTNTTTQGLQYIDFSSDNAIYLKGNSGSGNVGFLGGLHVEITMSIPTSREVIDPKFLPEHLQFGKVEFNYDITWDGNTDGKTCIDVGSFVFCKVSDLTPTIEQLYGVTMKTSNADNGIVLTKGEVDAAFANTADANMFAMEVLFIAYAPVSFDGITISEPGTYFVKVSDELFCCGLSNSGVAFKQLNSVYIPSLGPTFFYFNGFSDNFEDGILSHIDGTSVTYDEALAAGTNVWLCAGTEKYSPMLIETPRSGETVFYYIAEPGANNSITLHQLWAGRGPS